MQDQFYIVNGITVHIHGQPNEQAVKEAAKALLKEAYLAKELHDGDNDQGDDKQTR